MSDFKVLVPLDGSRTAEHALIYVDALRALGESKLLLFSVVDDSEEFRTLNSDEARERETNLLSTYLREVASDIKKHIGLDVETKVVNGSPAAAVLKEAHDYQPDLVVISTHGRSGPTRWRIGSVADKIIRGAPCNVLVIGPNATRNEKWLDARVMPPFRSVLVPLDGSPLAEDALTLSLPVADAYGSVLHLVRCVSVPPMVMANVAEMSYTPQLMEGMVEGAQEYLAELAKRAGPSLKVVTEVLEGPAETRLADYANVNDIDLIVMTTHGRSGILRSALGSVTDRMLGGPAPVLVVRSGQS